ncbi:MAG: hypothetical protein ACKO3P_16040, partial [Planctomycetaceae bacterium]
PPGLKIPAGKTGTPAATVPAPAAGPGAGAKTAEPTPPAERPEAPALPDGASFAAYGATALAAAPQDQAEGTAKIIRVGIIGLDTSQPPRSPRS